MTRLVASLQLAAFVVVVFILAVAVARLIDFIFGGSTALWIFLPTLFVIVFFVTFVVDAVTEERAATEKKE